ncbi:exported hypothetical protein [Cupriavidus oxalaticus]|uniref:Uncharacterized protein n=1 Tax=Cupriavidus oxalaticus TaxID=96344 RepID=A0A375FUM3_9BURK|nr:exported hypothetical protein [Cupriavidus oxalaticus]
MVPALTGVASAGCVTLHPAAAVVPVTSWPAGSAAFLHASRRGGQGQYNAGRLFYRTCLFRHLTRHTIRHPTRFAHVQSHRPRWHAPARPHHSLGQQECSAARALRHAAD